MKQRLPSSEELRAEKCRPWILRLTEVKDILGEPFEPGTFLNSPAAYLVTAAKHNRLDRVNQALDQVETIQKLIQNP